MLPRSIRSLAIGLLLATAAHAQTADTLSLGDAVRLAAAQSGRVTISRAQVAQSAARAAQARAARRPRVSVDLTQAGRTFNTATLGLDLPTVPGEPPLFAPNGEIAGPVLTTDLRAHLAADLVDLAARRREASAQAGVNAAEAAVEAAAEGAGAQAAAAYVAAAAARAELDARSADRALAEDLLRIARAQLDAGVGVGLDVTRAEARLAAVTAQTVAAQGRWEQARLDLLRAVGLSPDAPIAIRPVEAARAPADTTALLSVARANRADVAAAEARLAAIDAQVEAIHAERYPTLRVVADDGLIGKDPFHPLNTFDFGLQLSVPLFDGPRRDARVAEQEALRAEVEARQADLLDDIRFDLERARLDLGTSAEQVGAARVRLQLAEQEVEQASQRFRAGVAGNGDVVTASRSLRGARHQLSAAETAVQAARVRLAYAEGTLDTLP